MIRVAVLGASCVFASTAVRAQAAGTTAAAAKFAVINVL